MSLSFAVGALLAIAVLLWSELWFLINARLVKDIHVESPLASLEPEMMRKRTGDLEASKSP